MKQRLDEVFARQVFTGPRFGFLQGSQLLLTMIGVYGLLAYRVAQRTNEIGIRMALGATQGNLVRLVLRHALLLVCVGLAAGVPRETIRP